MERKYWLVLIANVQIMEVTFVEGACRWHTNDPSIPATPPVSYAPKLATCPANLRVSMSPNYGEPSSAEQAYITNKARNSLNSWGKYLARANMTGFEIESFFQSSAQTGVIPGRTLPNVAFALSGGGNRALLYAASILDAFDERNPQANAAGTGGLLQLANFATGLSASSWLLGSWANSDFAPFPFLAETAWHSAFSYGYLNWRRLRKLPWHYLDLRKKRNSGFPVSVVDLWGRLLSQKLLDSEDEGRTATLSSIRSKPSYLAQTFPFPIMVSTSRKGESEELNLQSPIYEFTPEDLNVWHPLLNASWPMEYLGSQTATATGEPMKCATGFDNIGFLMGASSNVFSYQDGKVIKSSFWIDLANLFLSGRFYEALVPNPFKGWGVGLTPGSGFPDGETDDLLLADGAMAEETLPLFPLLQPSRMIDVIIAVDAAVDGGAIDDTYRRGYPNGTSLYRTRMKLQHPDYRGYQFPWIPDTYTSSAFTDLGYHRRPTFFGCGSDVPLVVYLPNHFITQATNQSTMQAVYSPKDIQGFFENSYYIVTQTHPKQNGTDWSACLACAVVDGQNTRNGIPRTPQCKACFSKYCAGGFK